jgi:hypothetical protein
MTTTDGTSFLCLSTQFTLMMPCATSSSSVTPVADVFACTHASECVYNQVRGSVSGWVIRVDDWLGERMSERVRQGVRHTFFFRFGKMASGESTSLYCRGIVSGALP